MFARILKCLIMKCALNMILRQINFQEGHTKSGLKRLMTKEQKKEKPCER